MNLELGIPRRLVERENVGNTGQRPEQAHQRGPAVDRHDGARGNEGRDETGEQDVVAVAVAPHHDAPAGERLARPAGKIIQRGNEEIGTATFEQQLPGTRRVSGDQVQSDQQPVFRSSGTRQRLDNPDRRGVIPAIVGDHGQQRARRLVAIGHGGFRMVRGGIPILAIHRNLRKNGVALAHWSAPSVLSSGNIAAKIPASSAAFAPRWGKCSM